MVEGYEKSLNIAKVKPKKKVQKKELEEVK
jgi:hypothetical protein